LREALQEDLKFHSNVNLVKMVSVQINLLFGLSIDLILWSLILTTQFVNFFSYGVILTQNYTINLQGVLSQWEINNIDTEAFLDFSQFEDVECGDSSKAPEDLCDNILGLKLASLSYSSLSVLALISLTLSVFHYILLIALRVRTLSLMDYFHVLSMPLYFIATGLYIFLSSFNDILKARAEEGVIISYFACGMGVIELFYFVYLKKYKGWRLELLKYKTLEETNRYNLPRTHEDLAYSQAPATDRTKIDDIGKLYYDLMEKYENEVTCIQVNEKKAILDELSIYQQELEKQRGSKGHDEISTIENEKELIDLHKKIREYTETIQILEKELAQHREHPLKELYANNLEIIKQKDVEISEAFALVGRLQDDRERLIRENDELKDSKEIEELYESYANSLKEKEALIEEKDRIIADRDQQIDDKEKEIEEKEKEIEYLVQLHKEFEETIMNYKNHAIEYETAIQNYKNTVEEQEVTVKEKEFENNALYNQLERAVNSKEDLQLQIRNLKNNLNKEKEKLEEEVNKYEEIIEEKDEEIEELHKEIEEKDSEIIRLHEEVDNLIKSIADHSTNTDRSYANMEDVNQYSFIKTDHDEDLETVSKDEVFSQDSHAPEEFLEEHEVTHSEEDQEIDHSGQEHEIEHNEELDEIDPQKEQAESENSKEDLSEHEDGVERESSEDEEMPEIDANEEVSEGESSEIKVKNTEITESIQGEDERNSQLSNSAQGEIEGIDINGM
jgi:hypothetical protein